MNKLTRDRLGQILDSTGQSEYVEWHRERILSCVERLRDWLPDGELEALDLGHDPAVGLLLAGIGLRLTGNILPGDPDRIANGPGGTRTAPLPGGGACEWHLSEFDFEEDFPLGDRQFDVVTALEVIEHVVGGPRRFVREICRVLRPGGHFFVATPNVNSWTKIRRQFRHAQIYDALPYSQNYGPRHYMCHVYEYSPWELKELLKSEGFEIVRLETWNAYSTDPSGVRDAMLRGLVSASLLVTGHLREAALMHRNRGHQMAILARRVN